MKRAVRFLKKHIGLIVIASAAMVATGIAVVTMKGARGQIEFGSEWLIFPFAVFMYAWSKEVLEDASHDELEEQETEEDDVPDMYEDSV